MLLLAFLGLLAATGWLYHRRFERHQTLERIAAIDRRIADYEDQLATPGTPHVHRARLRLALDEERRRRDALAAEIAGLEWLF